jgi:hypothetical protein
MIWLLISWLLRSSFNLAICTVMKRYYLVSVVRHSLNVEIGLCGEKSIHMRPAFVVVVCGTFFKSLRFEISKSCGWAPSLSSVQFVLHMVSDRWQFVMIIGSVWFVFWFLYIWSWWSVSFGRCICNHSSVFHIWSHKFQIFLFDGDPLVVTSTKLFRVNTFFSLLVMAGKKGTKILTNLDDRVLFFQILFFIEWKAEFFWDWWWNESAVMYLLVLVGEIMSVYDLFLANIIHIFIDIMSVFQNDRPSADIFSYYLWFDVKFCVQTNRHTMGNNYQKMVKNHD